MTNTNFIERYIDLTECGAEYEISSLFANGWYIVLEGLTLMMMRKDI